MGWFDVSAAGGVGRTQAALLQASCRELDLSCAGQERSEPTAPESSRSETPRAWAWVLMRTALEIQGNDKEKQLKNYLPGLQDGIRINGFLN